MTNNKELKFSPWAITPPATSMNPLFTFTLYGAGMSVNSVLFYRYALAISCTLELS